MCLMKSSFSEASDVSKSTTCCFCANQKGSPLPLSAAVFTWGTYPSGRGGAPDWDGELQAWPGGGTEGGRGPGPTGSGL